MKGQQGRQLRLHRETLRQLSAADLDRAAGGGYVYGTTLQQQPKTNGWSTMVDVGCGV